MATVAAAAVGVAAVAAVVEAAAAAVAAGEAAAPEADFLALVAVPALLGLVGGVVPRLVLVVAAAALVLAQKEPGDAALALVRSQDAASLAMLPRQMQLGEPDLVQVALAGPAVLAPVFAAALLARQAAPLILAELARVPAVPALQQPVALADLGDLVIPDLVVQAEIHLVPVPRPEMRFPKQ